MVKKAEAPTSALFVSPDLWAFLTGRSEFSLVEGTTKGLVGFLFPNILHILFMDVPEDHPLTVHSVALQIIIGS
jgi:hypothetical protein